MREIEAALAPVIGSRGVALLYQRSLYLNQRSLYLSPASSPPPATRPGEAQGMPASLDLDALQFMLAQHSGADAIKDGTALLKTFYDLLVDLLGLSLTERLLRPVWANYSSGLAAPEGSS